MLKEYLQHSAGLMAMSSWLLNTDSQENVKLQGNVFSLPMTMGMRYSLGIPNKKRYGKTCFLAVPTEDLLWMMQIKWARAMIRTDKPSLFLITQKMTMEDAPDLPSIALGIPFDLPNKADLILPFGKIGIKGYYLENGEVLTENGPVRLSMELVKWEGEVFNEQEMEGDNSFATILKNKLNKTNKMENPGFAGKATDLKDVDQDIIKSMGSWLKVWEKETERKDKDKNGNGKSPDNKKDRPEKSSKGKK